MFKNTHIYNIPFFTYKFQEKIEKKNNLLIPQIRNILYIKVIYSITTLTV